MTTATQLSERPEIDYPDSDGLPMADNTLQYEWIVTIKGGLDAIFLDDPNVFVAGDLLWYPVKGEPKIRTAPDAMVAIGRPKGYRGSYKQWEEGNLAPQVVFEVLSPGNRLREMIRKFNFYQQYGVEEYYIYDPDNGSLDGWLRRGTVWKKSLRWRVSSVRALDYVLIPVKAPTTSGSTAPMEHSS
jgi:Uma2 family endonuclease